MTADVNWSSALLWGFAATVTLTAIMTAAKEVGMSRLSLPYLLGSIVTADRDRAQTRGLIMHFVAGWAFTLLYAAAFESWDRATWWLGASIGVIHAMFVLTAAMTVLPSLHPRMASEQRGPSPTRQLEPPGFLALNYGPRTPYVVIAAHIAFGAILGAFYQLAG
ncbi:MAG TPA: hypothetical protein VMM78_02355 [Thermomicrobiales bacterium]|nr:hypothetical protein [Thermomicrobiales bacterium]